MEPMLFEEPVAEPDDLEVKPCQGCGRPTRQPGGWHAHCRPAAAGLTDPLTSTRAAKVARRGAGSPLAREILGELQLRGELGATDDELELKIPGHPHGSYAKRRLDLVSAGRVRDSGKVRPTRFGGDAIVWVAVA